LKTLDSISAGLHFPGICAADSQIFNGRWNQEEKVYHINYLELLAIVCALKALCKDKNSLHVQILTDNTSAVAHINNMGGIKSEDLNSL
jgi:ribonuclease HI